MDDIKTKKPLKEKGPPPSGEKTLARARAADRKAQKSESEGKKADEPTPEQLKAAVAAVVLSELEMWPEEIQALIGVDHPNKDSFTKGVEYVIGAYMHIARRNLDRQIRDSVKSYGVEIAKKMGPVVAEAKSLRSCFDADCAVEQTKIARRRREALILAAKEINAEFDALQKEAEGRQPPEDLVRAQEAIKNLELEYEGEVQAIESTSDITREAISVIEEGSKSWNSKSRKARREAHKTEKKAAEAKTVPEEKEEAVTVQPEQV